MSPISHTVATKCAVPAQSAYAFMANPLSVGLWALGCWDAELVGENLYAGTSLFDGEKTYVQIWADDAHMIVDFAVGIDPAELELRISARVVRGQELKYGEHCSIVTLTAWRSNDMTDDRWHRLCVSHETEIYLLRNQVERAI